MLDLLTEVLAAAPARCTYAEARHVATDAEDILVRNGRVDHVDSSSADGIGVRVRAGGGWGFAATRETTRAGAERALARALAIAESQPAAPAGPLAPVPAATGHWRGEHEQDPFDVSLEDKLELLCAAEQALRGDPRIVRSDASCASRRVRTAFASTEGAACTQERVECGAAVAAIAVDGDELQVRSYPGAHGGSAACAGWEHVLAFDLVGHAPRVAAEALELLSAPECPAGRMTVILGGEQLALQIHESIGHALELDRMLLMEASYAGTSWVVPGDLGTLRYGSEQLNITADATLPGGLGTFGWDDEGVAAARTPLIEAGVLRAALSDRGSAAAVGLAAVRRLRARRRLRAPADRAHDERLDRARRRRLARRPRRRHRQRPVPGDQPLVVDRRPPPALPVRDRGRARDPRRRARAPAAQRLLRGRDADVLERPGCRLLGAGVAAVGRRQLRQGRARPGHARLARHGAGALSRRAGRGGVSVSGSAAALRTPLEIAERALALADTGTELQVTVMRERSLMSRFARSAPTQATEIDDTAVEILVVRDGHSALASTNRLDDDALRDTARRADAAARASARSGAGNHPGLAPAGAGRAARRRPTASTPTPPCSIPPAPAPRWAARSTSPPSTAWRRSASGPPAPCAPRSPRRAACGSTRR